MVRWCTLESGFAKSFIEFNEVYTEGGSIQLSLSEEKSPKGENYIRIHIKVKDNGIGMSPDFLKRIYESYSRADETRIHKTEGAGLGMAITKYIVDAMKGTIDIKSEPDKGSEFFLTFDFEKAAAVEMDMVLPSWNMLVVDDDELLCETAMDATEIHRNKSRMDIKRRKGNRISK